MHCGSCALLIDDTLEDLPGVASTQTSMKKRLSTVDLDATVTTPDDVVAAITELGYTAVVDG
ncbi:heavy-metal-associated domain-containing protein [Nocardia cyriacigeorgica]|uniref:Heavy-metal-associated domain-containing protein n=2 Tax=Nocardiaceae TaxID=85025 RepID=A0A6P1CN10_9NOCA|nr:heavy-metal-associated domain-containing protein [Nocardia cyriacigeorgica]